MSKPRINVAVTLDPDLVEYVKNHRVGPGEDDARSLSAYVNEALAERVREDRRRRLLLETHRVRARAEADHQRVDRLMSHVRSQLAAMPRLPEDAG